MLNDGEIVSYVPPTVLRVSWLFLRRGGRIVCRVTGKRTRDVGLEVLCVHVHFDDVNTIIYVHWCGR